MSILEGSIVEYFGKNLKATVTVWWSEEFAKVLDEKYGVQSVAAVILRPWVRHDWRSPESAESVLVELWHGPECEDDLRANAYHKLRFALRTGLDSSQADRNPHLLEPGDFPNDGAAFHKGFVGAASGLPGESDVWVVQQVIDKLVSVRGDVGEAAIRASRRGQPGWKYLPDETPPD